jgi:putative dehydrogenase
VNIGIVGIGNMGLAIALRLRERGHTVEVRDVDHAREVLAMQVGCRAASDAGRSGSPMRPGDRRRVDAPQTGRWCWPAGLARAMHPGSAVMLCPTIGPADTEALAQTLVDAGVDWIDAPMSGGPVRARAGTMSLMVACAPTRCSSAGAACWSDVASPVFRVGRRPAMERVPSSSTTCWRPSTSQEHREALALADAPRPRSGTHAFRDREVERPELDRQRPDAPGAGR